MERTLFDKAITRARQAIQQHGLTLLHVYKKLPTTSRGFDAFVYSPTHLDSDQYQYIGYLDAQGEYHKMRD